jgi:hypothetical protein
VEDGDHSFKVLKRAGVTQEDAYKAVLDRIEQFRISGWIGSLVT